jgi:hypothetical protein
VSGELLPAVNTWFKLREIILLICTMATTVPTFRIGERTILLRFLGIIVRVLRLEVSVWIS